MVIYITYVALYNINYTGIRKKILAQIKVLEHFFGKVYYTCYSGHMVYLMCEGSIIDRDMAATKESYNRAICTWIEKYKIEKAYVRYEYADKWFLGLLKCIKEREVKSIMEIPTYPNDGEITDRRIQLEDGYYRKQICRYIDTVATNADDTQIWGMQCIRLVNGVELEENPLCSRTKEAHKIVMIGVSTLMGWQGYERIIEGLYNYYSLGGNWDLKFKIVGEGPEKAAYSSLSERYHLSQRVEFCGRLEGAELDRQYDLSDLAVSSLGRYKSDISYITPIKGAEYCARGIPFICGYHDMRFSGDEEFILNVPNDPTPINMDAVIDFYKNISLQKGYQKQMRDYAEKYLSWNVIMKPIVEYLSDTK